jgi:hypothetical protein
LNGSADLYSGTGSKRIYWIVKKNERETPLFATLSSYYHPQIITINKDDSYTITHGLGLGQKTENFFGLMLESSYNEKNIFSSEELYRRYENKSKLDKSKLDKSKKDNKIPKQYSEREGELALILSMLGATALTPIMLLIYAIKDGPKMLVDEIIKKIQD